MVGWHDAGLSPPSPPAGSIAALRAAFHAGQTDPVRVLERLALRLESGAPDPFSDLCLERAGALASASAERWRSAAPLGPLDGVPVALKDQHDIRGLPTRAGVSTRHTPARRDGELVGALEALGAVVPGKTHSTEWGLCPVGRSDHVLLPGNPFDPARGAGGSSTGAGVAVSTGLTPAAIGSDAGGSVRIPAALLGLFAIKPQLRQPRLQGDLFGRGSLTANGPVAACAEDLLPLLSALGHGCDAAAIGRGVRGCRVGVVAEAWAMAEPAVARRGQELLTALAAEGAELRDLSCPALSDARGLGVAVVLAESSLALEAAAAVGELGPAAALAVQRLSHGPWPPPGLIPGLRRALAAELLGLLEQVHLLALPTTLAPAPPLALPADGALLDEGDNHSMCATTFAANLCDLPAGSLPAGQVGGMPVGLQLVGRPGGLGDLLAVMAQAERVGFGCLRPPGFEALEG